MKKGFKYLVVVIVLGLGIAFFLPKENTSTSVFVNATDDAVRRHITDKSLWAKWFPAKKINDSVFVFEKNSYQIEKIMLNGFETTIANNGDTIKGLIQVISDNKNISNVVWTPISAANISVFNSPSNYFRVKKFTKNINSLLQKVKLFFDDDKNIYGFNVKLERTKDYSLLVLKQKYSIKPTTNEIYNQVKILENYVKEINAEIKNSPMVNIHSEVPNEYELMTAIPTKKNELGKGEIVFKELIDGNILVANIIGGEATTERAEKQMQLYIQDHHKTCPAIPYLSLVTDRRVEKDSLKWISKLYCPVFY